MAPKVAIVFTDMHLAYSPTTLGIYDALAARGCRVSIFALTQRDKPFERSLGREVMIVDAQPLNAEGPGEILYRIRRRMERRFGGSRDLPKLSHIDYISFAAFDTSLRRFDPDEIIAVDSLAMAICQRVFPRRSINLISLEILEPDNYECLIDTKRISRVVIQSKVRLNRLFPKAPPKAFFVQNAPTFTTFDLDVTSRDGLVYCGTATEGFGILSCLRFVLDVPGYHLTLKGAVTQSVRTLLAVVFPELISDNRITIDTSYVEMSELLGYLRKFKLGFCFYDIRFDCYNRFNYHNAPSGKMFTYFASGVPVIGSNLPGLKPVEEFSAGVLIDDLDVHSIQRAAAMIEADYEKYAQGCLEAARHFSFESRVTPFIEDLMGNTKVTSERDLSPLSELDFG